MKRAVDFLKSLYRGWMKVAHVIGKITTTIVLTIFYLVVMGIAKAAMWAARKDLLDERWRDRESYWKKKRGFFSPPRRSPKSLLKPWGKKS